jgi:predicted ATPase
MLYYLAYRERHVVSHEELTKHLWPDTFVESSNVKKYIRELRRALEDDPDEPKFIETLPRRGYRFLATTRDIDPVVSGPPQSRIRPAFVGREPHLARLRECFATAEAGTRQIVFLTGEPGSGKSALVEEFLLALGTQRPLLSSLTRCLEAEIHTDPYEPLMEILEDLCEADSTGSIIRLLGDYAPAVISRMSGHIFREHPEFLARAGAELISIAAMKRQIIHVVEILARTRPMLLVFEDIQWADRATIDWLNRIAHRTSPARLMLVATCMLPLPNTPESPIRKMKLELLSRSLSVRIRLNRITQDDISMYLARSFPDVSPDNTQVEGLFEQTGGNPFMMHAVLEPPAIQDVTAPLKGKYPSKSTQLAALSNVKVKEFLGLQMDALPSADRGLLEAASVVGLTFSVSSVAAILDTDPDTVQGGLKTYLDIDRFVRNVRGEPHKSGEDYEFVLAGIRDVLYEGILPMRKQQMHRRLAEWLETQIVGRDAGMARLIARHFEAAKEWTKAAPYLLLSSEPATT